MAYTSNIGGFVSGVAPSSLQARIWILLALPDNRISVQLRPLFGLEKQKSRPGRSSRRLREERQIEVPGGPS